MKPDTCIYLASASPRRRELLRQVGIAFEAIPANVPEQAEPGEAPRAYVARVAAAKARCVAREVAARGLAPRPVLGADTEVVLEGEILGKPRDRSHGVQLLRRLAGHSHQVLTGICLIHNGTEYGAVSDSRVSFAPLSDAEIVRYWETGECADKAGGYAIQGLAAGFISRLEGSYSGVMGLPLCELVMLLKKTGVEWP